LQPHLLLFGFRRFGGSDISAVVVVVVFCRCFAHYLGQFFLCCLLPSVTASRDRAWKRKRRPKQEIEPRLLLVCVLYTKQPVDAYDIFALALTRLRLFCVMIDDNANKHASAQDLPAGEKDDPSIGPSDTFTVKDGDKTSLITVGIWNFQCREREHLGRGVDKKQSRRFVLRREPLASHSMHASEAAQKSDCIVLL